MSGNKIEDNWRAIAVEAQRNAKKAVSETEKIKASISGDDKLGNKGMNKRISDNETSIKELKTSFEDHKNKEARKSGFLFGLGVIAAKGLTWILKTLGLIN